MIRVKQTSSTERARAVLAGDLTFGKSFADLMLVMTHTAADGWRDAEVVPFAPIALSPAAKVFHYGLEIFEAYKAYPQPDGEVALFRPGLNAKRLNRSATRLGMPAIPESLQIEGVHVLVNELREWMPVNGGTLYLRPVLIGTEAAIGVKPSTEHLYYVIASPVGRYFDTQRPLKIKIEDRMARAAMGGVGAAKTGGNYAAGMLAKQRAQAEGFDEVIWTDAVSHRYLEELSAMNFFMVRNGALVTPPLNDAILDGVTRRSVITLAQSLGIDVIERPIAVDALLSDVTDGKVTELMAVGTAVVITAVGALGFEGREYPIGAGTVGPVTKTLLDALLGIQFGTRRDPFQWMQTVPRLNAARTAVGA